MPYSYTIAKDVINDADKNRILSVALSMPSFASVSVVPSCSTSFNPGNTDN